jgi:hypothetical protein
MYFYNLIDGNALTFYQQLYFLHLFAFKMCKEGNYVPLTSRSPSKQFRP